MGVVYRQMQRTVRVATDFDVRTRLKSTRGGQRLSAYAFLWENPDPGLAHELVQAILSEEQAYGAYKGALALERLVDDDPHVLTPDLRAALEDHVRKLPARSDRAAILTRILDRHPTGR
jgi:hypothetical protein